MTGWDYFDQLAAGYDRLCFGNVVQATHPTQVRLLHTMWERGRQYPQRCIHVLGPSACEWCLPCPPDSCDSSSWLNSLRYPAVRTESAGLRRLGEPGHRFLCSETANRDISCRMHADPMTHTLANWRAMQDRHADFGEIPHPPRDDRHNQLRRPRSRPVDRPGRGLPARTYTGRGAPRRRVRHDRDGSVLGVAFFPEPGFVGLLFLGSGLEGFSECSYLGGEAALADGCVGEHEVEAV
ncbi:hypothetical protein GCM10022222_85630 [Amycolatopsis ultiminotia]|uniref:Uncharacterized protein n=1 Tax=Amycolatopsis ultiminotia TaxID=543629 RepID=A0ABP6YU85_9PSEU